jgi:transposase
MYGAVEPRTGAHFGMVCSRGGCVDTEMMSLFLWWLSKEIKDDEHLLLLLDGAGWHKSKKLRVLANITLRFLPPYSPELNPVELVWQWLNQHHLANRVLAVQAELEQACITAWNTLTADRIKSPCAISWLLENEVRLV